LDECTNCRSMDGFLKRTMYEKPLSISSDAVLPTVVTECPGCFQKGYMGLSGLDKIMTLKPTEFFQEAISLLNGITLTH
jgi:hypothetical protein